MKLILQNDRIAGTATDDYTGQDAWITAPEDYDPAKEYRVIDGELVEVVPQVVSAMAGLLAIDEFGLAAQYTAWATSPDRTFLERAFIDKAQTWKRDNAALTAAADALGLTSEQLDAMFMRARELEMVL